MCLWKVMIHILLLPTLAEVELTFMFKNAFDKIERTDLNVQHDDFESSWI